MTSGASVCGATHLQLHQALHGSAGHAVPSISRISHLVLHYHVNIRPAAQRALHSDPITTRKAETISRGLFCACCNQTCT